MAENTRSAQYNRKTKETDIRMSLRLDGSGQNKLDTGIGFFDHMLDGFARHGFFDLEVSIVGDLIVDTHHTIEDCGIVLGNAIRKALGNKRGIKRYGSCMLPMDETLALCAVDLSGRPYLSFDCEFPTEKVGYMDTEMVREFFYAVSYSAGMNLHLKLLDGKNSHHMVEALFKAFGRALDEATQIDPPDYGYPLNERQLVGDLMQHKKLIASIYIKDGEAVDGLRAQNRIADVEALVKRYNDSGIDKLLIFDLSEDEQEHEKNILAIKELNRLVEVPVCAGGNISRTEDIKKLLYAGCQQVMLNSTKPVTARLAEEAGARFGREKIAITLQNVDILFKHREAIEAHVSEMIVLNQDIVDTVDNVSSLPYVVKQDQYDLDRWVSLLRREQVSGIFGSYLNDPDTDVMKEKMILAMNGIKTQKFESAVAFDRFQLNSDGLIPVIVQDYRTLEVLMLAYMNREAFSRTIESGKMTYFSRSRQELWLKGETSGHYQYVKSLTLDCDNDTILAKVSQVGVACHTGAPSCFFQDLVQKDTVEKNPLKVFESVYSVIADRKVNPKKGSYTNYLLEKGLDKILKKDREEATELVIAAKNPDPEELKYEISDLLYHMMVLMLEKGVTWEDVSRELAQR